jgi:predicted RNA-binding protein with PIN domain
MPYLIDGHNLIGRAPGLRLDDPDDEMKLVQLLRRYLARLRKRGIVVFDRGAAGERDRLSNRTLRVRFARGPQSADDVLIDLLRAERNPRGWVVITSDGRVARDARQAGATVIDSAEFAREMLSAPGVTARSQKEAGLDPAEVAQWEQEFKARR